MTLQIPKTSFLGQKRTFGLFKADLKAENNLIQNTQTNALGVESVRLS
jgi:hypothetical protein